MVEPIPAPRPLPILGNALDLDAEFPMTSLMNLSAQYGERHHDLLIWIAETNTHRYLPGEIFKLTLGGHDRVFVCSQQLVNEMCDEKRFQKAVTGALLQIRGAVHDGLFTAFPGEHNWEVAHRALMPAFGPMPISNMFDGMRPIRCGLSSLTQNILIRSTRNV